LKVSIIRPTNDPTAFALGRWAPPVRKAIKSSGHTLCADLRGRACTRAAFEEAVRASDVAFYFGHGEYDRLFGKASLLDAENVEVTSGRIVMAVACSSARDLGKKAVKAGALGYLGFTERLILPLKNQFALGAFRKASIAGMLCLLQGGSLKRAHSQMTQAFDKVVNYFIDGPGQGAIDVIHGGFIWMSAFWNQAHIKLLTKKSAGPRTRSAVAARP